MTGPAAMLLYLSYQGAPTRPTFEQAQSDMFFPLATSGVVNKQQKAQLCEVCNFVAY